MQFGLRSLFVTLGFVLAARAFAVQEPTPTLKAVVTAYSTFDLNNFFQTHSKQGILATAYIKEGNWTHPSGELYATVVTPTFGGETENMDTSNIMRVDSHSVVRFASDGVVALVHFQGIGTEFVKNQGIVNVLTSSTANQYLVNKNLLAIGHFVSNDTLKEVFYEVIS